MRSVVAEMELYQQPIVTIDNLDDLYSGLVGGVLCVMVFLIPRYSHTVTRVPFGLAIAIGTLGSVLMGK
jgi:hypothetical protein